MTELPATETPSIRRRLLADVRPLQESPEYRRLWVGAALSAIGNRMTGVAVPVQIYALTHSSLAVGLIGIAHGAPLIALGLLGGSFADALDRRKLVLAASSLLALVSLLFTLQAYFDLRQLWLLYMLLGIQSALWAVDQPTRRAFIPRLLPSERIPAATALAFLSFHITNVLGPVIAGVIIAAAGLPAAYAVDTLSFAFTIYSVLRLPAMRIRGSATPPGLHSMLEGLRFVRRRSVLGMVLLVDLNATIFGMPISLFPALAATRFGGGATTVGLLFAAVSVGGVLSAVFSGPVSRVGRQGLAVLLAVAVWGAAIAGFGLSPWLWLAVLLLAVAGAADVVNGVFRTTILQVNTPDALQGRVSSLGFVVGAGGPDLGNVEAGVVAQLTSPVISAVSGGLACLVGVILLGLALPAFVRYDAGGTASGTTGAEPSKV
ncbi:MAG TPA: MFS transporter [Chloroflexota bacterium]|nr:MFS transporter [Chloroflexota bacterium]